MSQEYTVKLPIFEGPLDLLLHLIKSNEMEITEISISEITSQYLETLKLLETLDLDIAGDFLVMAATLINIKLRSILPDPEEEVEEEGAQEEGDDYLTARALMQRLIEYRRFKEAALNLGGMAERQSLIFVREVALPTMNQAQADPEVRGDLDLLLDAFSRVIKFVARRNYHEVQAEEYTVDDKIALVRRRLILESRISIVELFAQCHVKIEMIVTLIAILELCRLKEARISQVDSYGDIVAFPRSEGESEESGGEAAAGGAKGDAEELKRLEADILASRTGLVDNSSGEEDDENVLLEGLEAGAEGGEAKSAPLNEATFEATPEAIAEALAAIEGLEQPEEEPEVDLGEIPSLLLQQAHAPREGAGAEAADETGAEVEAAGDAGAEEKSAAEAEAAADDAAGLAEGAAALGEEESHRASFAEEAEDELRLAEDETGAEKHGEAAGRPEDLTETAEEGEDAALAEEAGLPKDALEDELPESALEDALEGELSEEALEESRALVEDAPEEELPESGALPEGAGRVESAEATGEDEEEIEVYAPDAEEDFEDALTVADDESGAVAGEGEETEAVAATEAGEAEAVEAESDEAALEETAELAPEEEAAPQAVALPEETEEEEVSNGELEAEALPVELVGEVETAEAEATEPEMTQEPVTEEMPPEGGTPKPMPEPEALEEAESQPEEAHESPNGEPESGEENHGQDARATQESTGEPPVPQDVAKADSDEEPEREIAVETVPQPEVVEDFYAPEPEAEDDPFDPGDAFNPEMPDPFEYGEDVGAEEDEAGPDEDEYEDDDALGEDDWADLGDDQEDEEDAATEAFAAETEIAAEPKTAAGIEAEAESELIADAPPGEEQLTECLPAGEDADVAAEAPLGEAEATPEAAPESLDVMDAPAGEAADEAPAEAEPAEAMPEEALEAEAAGAELAEAADAAEMPDASEKVSPDEIGLKKTKAEEHADATAEKEAEGDSEERAEVSTPDTAALATECEAEEALETCAEAGMGAEDEALNLAVANDGLPEETLEESVTEQAEAGPESPAEAGLENLNSVDANPPAEAGGKEEPAESRLSSAEVLEAEAAEGLDAEVVSGAEAEVAEAPEAEERDALEAEATGVLETEGPEQLEVEAAETPEAEADDLELEGPGASKTEAGDAELEGSEEEAASDPDGMNTGQEAQDHYIQGHAEDTKSPQEELAADLEHVVTSSVAEGSPVLSEESNTTAKTPSSAEDRQEKSENESASTAPSGAEECPGERENAPPLNAEECPAEDGARESSDIAESMNDERPEPEEKVMGEQPVLEREDLSGRGEAAPGSAEVIEETAAIAPDALGAVEAAGGTPEVTEAAPAEEAIEEKATAPEEAPEPPEGGTPEQKTAVEVDAAGERETTSTPSGAEEVEVIGHGEGPGHQPLRRTGLRQIKKVRWAGPGRPQLRQSATARRIKASGAGVSEARAHKTPASAGTKAKAVRSGFGRPGMIRPIRQRRIWLGGPLVQEMLRELEAAMEPAELDQILKEGLGRIPWQKRPGCALMLLVLVLLGGATTLAGLDAGRRVLERLAEKHRQDVSVAAVRAEMKEVGPLRGPED